MEWRATLTLEQVPATTALVSPGKGLRAGGGHRSAGWWLISLGGVPGGWGEESKFGWCLACDTRGSGITSARILGA
jgi:hypothetical protein